MADDSEQMDVDEKEGKTTAKWLVNRAKQSLKDNNIFEAKSWLLTAKTLYPKDFHVQVRKKLDFLRDKLETGLGTSYIPT